MGKFRSKLKGQTKGKRWPKGQSSSSNPETKKYRDLAKSRFFQENLGPSSLTSDALKKHDAVQSYIPKAPESSDMEEDTESSVGTQSSFGTMKSFASEWSDCSNMSFNRFLTVFRSDSALHKEMLAILAAITEVIKENGGSETPTEYFGSLMTTLEQVYNAENKNEDQVTAVLALLNMGIKTVPEAVLKKHFNDITLKILHILSDYADSENNTIMKSIFGILGSLLKIQELAVWNQPSTIQIFNALLNPFCIHTKPKWRKAAQHAVMSIITTGNFVKEGSSNPAADRAAEFCEQTLDSCMGSTSGVVLVSSVQAGQTTILHVLGLLKEIISKFSKHHIKTCCETILKLMTLNYPIVTSCGMQVLYALFSAQTAVIPGKLNAQLITALYEYQPSLSDVQPTQAWVTVMQQAHVHLADVDVALAMATLPKIIDIFTQLWLSEKAEIMTSATHALEILLKDALVNGCSSKELVGQHRSKVERCIQTIQLCLGYQYNASWHQVLHIVSVLFEVTGANCSDMLLGLLTNLAELRDSYKFSYNNELEHAVGAAIRSMGPEVVLEVITLKKPNGDLNIDRSWLLPVLKENIKCSTLEYFVKGILPLALYCHRRSAQLAQNNDGIGAHSSELLYLQLWNLLPCFCSQPKDIKDSFKTVAKVMGTAISDKKELRLAVMAALRRLISYAKESENQEDLQEISRFDKNYLPILFNVYTTKPIGTDEEGQRLAALDTIKLYLSIARPELTQQLFNNAIERLNSSSDEPEDHFIKESILDLIRALVPYQNAQNVEILYQQCIQNLPEIKNNKEQKKAYRLLEEVCGSESEGCQTFVKSNRKELPSIVSDLNFFTPSGVFGRCFFLNNVRNHRSKIENGLIFSQSVEEILADSDSEFEDMETDEPKVKNKKQAKTWIEEDPDNIVDFIDPSVISKITATKPGLVQPTLEKKKPEKDRGFKTAPDGRLIIKDDSSSDSDDDKKLKFSDDSDDDDDTQSKVETVLLTDRKRKRSNASVKSGFSSVSSQPPMKYKTGGVGIHRYVLKFTLIFFINYRIVSKLKTLTSMKFRHGKFAYIVFIMTSIYKRVQSKPY
uniref:RRP12-like protein n=1 Tax=Diabrotica virgifera virgifera TaxID=50390 RepID=A0A6P7FHR4_DIAVI